MIIALVAKIAMPVLLVGKSVRTPSLWSFRALVMSLGWRFSASRPSHSYSSQARLSVLEGSLPPSLGHHEQLEVDTQISLSLVQTIGTLLGVLAIATWAHLLRVSCTSVSFPGRPSSSGELALNPEWCPY